MRNPSDKGVPFCNVAGVSSARGKPGERYRLVGQYNFNSFNPTKKIQNSGDKKV